MATPDFDNVLGGPGKVQLATTDIGHTQGGITVTITPQNRAVNVDEFGSSACNLRHTGDEVRVTAPFAEWTADVIAEVYDPGSDQLSGGSGTGYMGVGRSGGFIYTAQALDVIPLLATEVAKKVSIFRAVAVGELGINFSNDSDRIFSVEFMGLVDESKTDGEMIGKIMI